MFAMAKAKAPTKRKSARRKTVALRATVKRPAKRGAAKKAKPRHVPWISVELETLNPLLQRQFVVGQVIVVNAGEVLTIPANMPHKAEALVDTVDLDIFTPPRADWINKTDRYLR